MELEILEGTVERVTYYNDETDYSVIRIAPSTPLHLWSGLDDEGLVTVVGNMPEVLPGESLRLEGIWHTHPRHGRQFRAQTVHRILPATIEGIRRYLASGMIKGIGDRFASRIVDHFGESTLKVLEQEPERLYEVEGIGRKRVHLIKRAWEEQKQIKAVMLFLQSHGISTALAVKIYRAYGDEAIEQVNSDPYRLARDIHGVGFKTADKIAQDLGLPLDHPQRLEAGVVYALSQATNDGHIYLPEPELAQAAATLLDMGTEEVEAAIERAAVGEMVKIEDVPDGEGGMNRAVYVPSLYYAEVGAARHLRRILTTPLSLLEPLQRHASLSSLIAQAAAEASVELSDQQQEAIRTALTHKVSILTGGPGTGKTTTLCALIGVLRDGYHHFALASPTGRAAKRLSEATGQPASTIHRMLGYAPTEGFAYDEDNPLPVDMVIVDEASMIDGTLANALFRAVDSRSHLLLVGDVDQLPSVGAGDVLRDMIRSGEILVTRLDVIFRQSAGSMIITNAHRVNQGEMPIFPDEAKDFFLFRIADDPQRAADLLVDVVQHRIPERFGFHPLNDIQVIVPMYRGPAGVSALNQRLQEALNPSNARLAERRFGGQVFRVGDKVLQTSNNYDKEVFNGDVGRIRSFDFSGQIMSVVFEDRLVEYDFVDVPELLHAYAISVHRSQGSEYPAVVMPILTQHYMLLQRNLLYTAITRAKELVVLVGSRKATAIAVKNDTVSRRCTTLAARLRGEI